MMNVRGNGDYESLRPGLLQPGVVNMLNRAIPSLVSQRSLDVTGVTSVTGVTQQQLTAGTRAGRILFHPALETYAGDPNRTIHRLRTSNPNCLEGQHTVKKLGANAFFSAAGIIMGYLSEGRKNKGQSKEGFKDGRKSSRIYKSSPDKQT